MNQYKNTYLDDFPVNEEGFLLINDPELIKALRRRAELKKADQDVPAYDAQITVKSS